jgi:hypothetical protein
LNVYANEFAKSTGYPLATVKRLCKEGVIPYIPNGRKYLINKERALQSLEEYSAPRVQEKKKGDMTTTPRKRAYKINNNIEQKGFLDALQSLCSKNI